MQAGRQGFRRESNDSVRRCAISHTSDWQSERIVANKCAFRFFSALKEANSASYGMHLSISPAIACEYAARLPQMRHIECGSPGHGSKRTQPNG